MAVTHLLLFDVNKWEKNSCVLLSNDFISFSGHIHVYKRLAKMGYSIMHNHTFSYPDMFSEFHVTIQSNEVLNSSLN